MVKAANVGFGYGAAGREAVVSADVEAGPGEVVALLGPNGAGKSTLLGLLDGRLEPRRGLVERPPDRTPEGLLAVGSIREETPHFDVLSGRDNALFFARAAGLPRATAGEEVDELFRRFSLTAEASRPVAEYSFGARRKLALVEALAHRPRLLLLDEPTAGLDAAARDALAGVLRDRIDGGAAVVLASHDTAFVEAAADRVVFMIRGRTEGGGRPAELVEALGGEVRILVALDTDFEPDAGFPRDGWRIEETGNPLVVRAPEGSTVLPDLCSALTSAGAGIREISVRSPDLGEVFRRVVGEPLPSSGAAGS